VRSLLLSVVLLSWTWAVVTVGSFMVRVLSPVARRKPLSVADFTKYQGPWIVLATVMVPLARRPSPTG
jgi:PAT family beta-lactamase induction signal transducer AmpG